MARPRPLARRPSSGLLGRRRPQPLRTHHGRQRHALPLSFASHNSVAQGRRPVESLDPRRGRHNRDTARAHGCTLGADSRSIRRLAHTACRAQSSQPARPCTRGRQASCPHFTQTVKWNEQSTPLPPRAIATSQTGASTARSCPISDCRFSDQNEAVSAGSRPGRVPAHAPRNVPLCQTRPGSRRCHEACPACHAPLQRADSLVERQRRLEHVRGRAIVARSGDPDVHERGQAVAVHQRLTCRAMAATLARQ